MNTAFIQRLTKMVEANLVNKPFGIKEVVNEIRMSDSKLHRHCWISPGELKARGLIMDQLKPKLKLTLQGLDNPQTRCC